MSWSRVGSWAQVWNRKWKERNSIFSRSRRSQFAANICGAQVSGCIFCHWRSPDTRKCDCSRLPTSAQPCMCTPGCSSSFESLNMWAAALMLLSHYSHDYVTHCWMYTVYDSKIIGTSGLRRSPQTFLAKGSKIAGLRWGTEAVGKHPFLCYRGKATQSAGEHVNKAELHLRLEATHLNLLRVYVVKAYGLRDSKYLSLYLHHIY